VEHKLAGYAWNLVERYATDLVFDVTEIRSDNEAQCATFRFKNRFGREHGPRRTLTKGLLCEEHGFRVRCAVLDHRIPCLGFAIEERQHVNVWKNRLDQLGVPVGPWLREAKRAILEGRPDDTPFRVAWREGDTERDHTLSLGALKRDVMRIVPGQKLGYVVDVTYTPENVRRIVDLVSDADILFIEAPFARDDAPRAADRAHLTEQAGRIARLARAKRVEPFHFSPRYAGEEPRLMREVAEASGLSAQPTVDPQSIAFEP